MTAATPEQAADRRDYRAEAKALSDLRARLLRDGWMAESPAFLVLDAEATARAERADYTD